MTSLMHIGWQHFHSNVITLTLVRFLLILRGSQQLGQLHLDFSQLMTDHGEFFESHLCDIPV